MKRPHSPPPPLLITIWMLIFNMAANRTLASDLLFECTNFDPQTLGQCGSDHRNRWSSANVQTLPKVAANAADLVYVLDLQSSTSNELANFVLSGPAARQLRSVDNLCVQYAIIASDDCTLITVDNGDNRNNGVDANRDYRSKNSICQTNVTIYNPATQADVSPIRAFNFADQAWTIANYQFDLAALRGDDRDSITINLHGSIHRSSQNRNRNRKSNFSNATNLAELDLSSSSPYLAIKYVNVFNRTCTDRIGKRQGFWIAVMVIFSVISIYTFIHISVHYTKSEHVKRTSGF